MTVMVISCKGNDHADVIQKETAKHTSVVRIDVDQLNDTLVSFWLGGTNSTDEFRFDGKIIDPTSITGIFFHQAHISLDESRLSDEIDREISLASWRAMYDWLEIVLKDAVWANAPSVSRTSASNAVQFLIAKKLGFRIPTSNFGNDLVTIQRLDKKAIVKLGTLPGIRLENTCVLTQLIDPSSLHEQDIRGAPCLFQEYIEKDYEIRVYVIKNRVVACKIESQKSEKTKIDWRNYDLKRTPHYEICLEKDLEDKCIALVQQLGLTFGAIDLIRTPEGEIVFLECNTQGHWLWIEELTGIPVTQTLSECLCAV